jgi:SET domain-containing protein
MMLVPTILRPSQIEGFGLYAAERIPLGTPVWRLHREVDIVVAADQLKYLPSAIRHHFDRYAYLNFRSGEYILCGDNGKFFNHSTEPNTGEVFEDAYGFDYAARDIEINEELTTDYRGFDGEWAAKLVNMVEAR